MNETEYVTYLQLIQTSINDELSAVVLYKRIAESLTGPGAPVIAKELREHADDEYRHFKLLLEFCSHYGILQEMSVELESEANLDVSSSTETLIAKVQSLELEAISTYKKLLNMSKQYSVVEGCKLFLQILTEEQEHYDDLAFFDGKTRSLPLIKDTTEKQQSVASLIAQI